MKARLEWYLYRYILPERFYIKYLKKNGAIIGENCDIHRSASFGSEPYLVRIGNDVRITQGVQLLTHDGGYWVLRRFNAKKFSNADCFGRVVIKDNVHIGINAIIMPGVTIGENSVIACGAVVTHDVPANSIFGGVPAKEIEDIWEYSKKAESKLVNTKSMTMEKKREFLLQKMTLSYEKKESLIDEAQELYRECFSRYKQSNDFGYMRLEQNPETFNAACRPMSMLVSFLAKEKYGFVGNDNIIIEGTFNNQAHCFNIICGEIVDSTIIQFGDCFSPYDSSNNRLYRYDMCSDQIEFETYEIKEEIDEYQKRNA